ncbi:phosphate uptake regulator PhoU [Sulfurimonas sp. SAG-AH-194-C21]|nr:PhoU domain-containing protein [Sulfurimonas sp. SAG-AH-194-C21]MDF1883280.1 phosphate uptake regulator PhoU [Sulfurimonas sp. SAG-AH-194-C21]
MQSNFQTNLNNIKAKIIHIGDGLLKANTLITEALTDCNQEKFQEARSHIKNINSKADDIDNTIIKVLALYTPEARDLRQVIAYLKITNELSRACSNTRSFIRGFTDVCKDLEVSTINEYAVPMQTSTVKAIKLTLSMLECEDEEEIQEIYNDVLIEENKTDDLYEMVERNLSLQADGSNAFEKFHKMLRALRKSGKIASRAISIANLLVYAKVGGNFHN